MTDYRYTTETILEMVYRVTQESIAKNDRFNKAIQILCGDTHVDPILDDTLNAVIHGADTILEILYGSHNKTVSWWVWEVLYSPSNLPLSITTMINDEEYTYTLDGTYGDIDVLVRFFEENYAGIS
jgi:hypothetical protein